MHTYESQLYLQTHNRIRLSGYMRLRFAFDKVSLHGLLAKIKCSICSYQLNLWYLGHTPQFKIKLIFVTGGCAVLALPSTSMAAVLHYLCGRTRPLWLPFSKIPKTSICLYMTLCVYLVFICLFAGIPGIRFFFLMSDTSFAMLHRTVYMRKMGK